MNQWIVDRYNIGQRERRLELTPYGIILRDKPFISAYSVKEYEFLFDPKYEFIRGFKSGSPFPLDLPHWEPLSIVSENLSKDMAIAPNALKYLEQFK